MSVETVPVLADATLIDGFQVACILLAVERKSLSKAHACNVLGMTPQEFDAWRKQVVDVGRAFSRKLAAARRDDER